jgi:uncharacterized protein
MSARHRIAVVLVLALSGLASIAPPGGTAFADAQVFDPVQLRSFPKGQMTIERAQGRDSFHIWIADTPERFEQGLMWLRELPADHGMVFLLAEPRPMNMWMKNTYVPLDMLFIGPEGRINSISRDRRPLSLELIGSGGPVSAVVEILGGEAQRRGISIGDRIVVLPQSR